MLMLLLSALLHSSAPARAALPVMEPNDNRHAAGTLSGRVFTLVLEAREGVWFPEGPAGRSLEASAWGEPGKPLLTPGPLIRVPVGTEIRVTLRNTLARPLTVFGLGAKRGMADSVMLAAGAEREVRFTASVPGTYYYAARSAPGPLGLRNPEDTQLNGAIIVDPPGAAARPGERTFLISWWFTLDSTSKTGLGHGTMAMNGLSWPHTERLDMVQGDSAYWRIINLTESPHPMHLHGFYFQMESKGDGTADTLYAKNQQRLAVTESIGIFQTMSFAWSPSRPGNWIYHCHFIGHVSHLASLDTDRGEMDHDGPGRHDSDRPHQMFGLVLGIRVAPRGQATASTKAPREIRLLIRQKPGVYGKHAGYAYVLSGTPEAEDAAPLPAPPGPTLVLRKDEPVAVTIVNRSRDRAAVHWHGIELESYPDGVPDWSGWDKEILPSVAPGDSITVRFTPPRAGTFMYHSHFNEDQQISSGLYGALLVLEPGEQHNPATDKVMFFSSAGPTVNVVTGPFAPTMLNGQMQPDTMELRAGTTYRLRLINMTGDINTLVSLSNGGKPVEWRAVAKDGAMLPRVQATRRPASLSFDPGEIYDFEFTPAAPGNLVLNFGPPDAPPEFGIPKRADVVVRVRK